MVRIWECYCSNEAEAAVKKGECEFALTVYQTSGEISTLVVCKMENAELLAKRFSLSKEDYAAPLIGFSSFSFNDCNANETERKIRSIFP